MGSLHVLTYDCTSSSENVFVGAHTRCKKIPDMIDPTEKHFTEPVGHLIYRHLSHLAVAGGNNLQRKRHSDKEH